MTQSNSKDREWIANRIAGNDYVQVLGSVYKIRTTKIWHLLNDADRLARAEALLPTCKRAIETAMSEAVGQGVTDWGAVNKALYEINAFLSGGEETTSNG